MPMLPTSTGEQGQWGGGLCLPEGSEAPCLSKARLQFSTHSRGRVALRGPPVAAGSSAPGSDKLLSPIGVPSVPGAMVVVTAPPLPGQPHVGADGCFLSMSS